MKDGSTSAHFTDEKVEELTGKTTFPWSAAKQRMNPAPNHPTRSRVHQPHAGWVLQRTKKPPNSPRNEQYPQGRDSMDNPHISCIPKHLKEPNSQSTSEYPERLESSVPLFPTLAKLRPHHRSISPSPPRRRQEQQCLGEGAGAQEREQTHHKQNSILPIIIVGFNK